MSEWFQAFIFFLPAGIANATPVLANKIPVLKNWRAPLDFGLTWRGKRLLGSNKTWRGLVTGTVLAGLTALVLSPVNGSTSSLLVTFLIGLTLGLGALVGDAVESGFKRRRGIAAGRSWFPFDQIDYIIGGLVFVWPFVQLRFSTMALIFVTFFGLHLLTAYVGYLLGLKSRPI